MHSYGRILNLGMAFYDCRTSDEIENPEAIIASPILFIVVVYDHVIKSGTWEIVGYLPLEKELQTEPPKFIKVIGFDDKYEITYEDGSRKPATKEECEGLERVVAWDAEGVQERLNDYYAGRQNFWVECFKP